MRKRILIVGAGLAGSSLGLALRKSGLTADIIEREPQWSSGAAGIYLLGNAMLALRQLDLEHEVIEAGALIGAQTFFNHRGQKLAEVDTRRFWASCGPCVGVSREHLQRILARALGDNAVRFSTTVTGIEERQDETLVTLNGGLTFAYDLVVGADGQKFFCTTTGLSQFCLALLWAGCLAMCF